jgi:hypothetical protein
MHRVVMASCKIRILSRLQTTVLVMVLSFFVLSPLLASLSRQRRDHQVQVVILDNPLPRKNPAPADTTELIEKLAAATTRAARGRNKSEAFSPALWHQEHPCASRDEIYALYSSRNTTRNDTQTNPKWTAALQEYAILHRTCVLRMGDVDEFFLKRKHVDGCQFVVAGVSAGSGIGNKALSIVSALVYAVLTQRVLLVPLATAVPGVFCEPFEGSSWMVDPSQVGLQNPSP